MSVINPNFDTDIYLKYNPDIAEFFRQTCPNADPEFIQNQALAHYALYGNKEQRIFSKQQLKGTWVLEEDVDQTFDHEFYASEYPDALEFCSYMKEVSLKERLFNHYDKFGKIESRYKNAKQKNRTSTKRISINNIFPLSSLVYKANRLECISLLVTNIEIQNGQYDTFINRLIKHIKKKESQKLDFKIIVNQKNNHSIETQHLQDFFKNVDIIYLNLNENENLYIKDNRQLNKVPPYGRKSGPNIMFYKALEICKQYNTTLFLETDCFFNSSWLSKLKKFIDNCNGFWISGAVYDGVVPVKAGSEIATHINGGVGLYATGNETFQSFMKYCESFLVEEIANGLVGLAYDIGIKMYLDYISNTSFTNKEDILVCKFIHRHYLPNKIIGNFSTTNDNYIDIEEINRIYNYYIIHKKQYNKDPIA